MGLGDHIAVPYGRRSGESQPQAILNGGDVRLKPKKTQTTRKEDDQRQRQRIPKSAAHKMPAGKIASTHPLILSRRSSDNPEMNPIDDHVPDTSSETEHPFARLTPTLVLDSLASLGLWGDGRILSLNSFENRVYQAALESPVEGCEHVVLKFYRPERWTQAQIEEEHAFSMDLLADEVPVVAPMVLQGNTLHNHAGFSFSVCPRRGGRRPELDDFETLEWMGRFLARIHAVGAKRPFRHRPRLDSRTYAQNPRDWLLSHQAIAPEVQGAWMTALEEALSIIESHPALKADQPDTTGDLRLHGDCHPGNVLWTPAELPGGGPHFVDLDDAHTGPAVQDLWMLLSGERQQQTQQLSALLDGYEQVRPFDRRQLALIEPLRTLRLIHYSGWLARRWHDPAFPINFPWFGSRDYWQGQVDMLHEQIEAMQDAPLYA